MELKKCPFCGGEPEMLGGDDVYHGEPFWYVGCRCLASMKGEETMEGAAENWNRRAAEQKKGRWEMKPDPYGFFRDVPVCSECGCMTTFREKTMYCPNCGADMRGDDDVDPSDR